MPAKAKIDKLTRSANDQWNLRSITQLSKYLGNNFAVRANIIMLKELMVIKEYITM